MITAVGAAGMVAAIAVGGFALVGLGAAGTTRDTVDALGDARSHTQQIEYYNGDVSGWQTAYAWDARRIGPVEAVKPDAGNRAGFLADADALRAELERGGVRPTRALVTGLLEEAREHAERRELEDAQHKRISALGVPTYELTRLPDGVDLGGLYELAAELCRQGMA